MGIMDNEGHDARGFGNVPRAATTLDEVLSLRSENARLRAELHLASGLALAHCGEVERLRALIMLGDFSSMRPNSDSFKLVQQIRREQSRREQAAQGKEQP